VKVEKRDGMLNTGCKTLGIKVWMALGLELLLSEEVLGNRTLTAGVIGASGEPSIASGQANLYDGSFSDVTFTVW
jgi:hypothetical protein